MLFNSLLYWLFGLIIKESDKLILMCCYGMVPLTKKKAIFSVCIASKCLQEHEEWVASCQNFMEVIRS